MKSALLPAILTLLALFFAGSALAQDLLLFEDFEDGSADGFSVLDPLWTVEGGVYHCSVEGASQFSLSAAGDASWGDYTASCDVLVEGSVNHVLVFRLQDRYNFYDINLRADPYNDVVLTKVVGGMDTWHVVADFAAPVGEWHALRVGLQGSRIDVEVDGRYLFSHRDRVDPYLTGGIALSGYAGGFLTWQEAYFDNVIVTKETVITVEERSWDGVKALFR